MHGTGGDGRDTLEHTIEDAGDEPRDELAGNPVGHREGVSGRLEGTSQKEGDADAAETATAGDGAATGTGRDHRSHEWNTGDGDGGGVTPS